MRNYQTAGVFLIVAGSLQILSSSDDLRRVFAAPSFGIALKSEDAVGRLNGRFPRSLAEVELPMGRAFIVRSGITSMLQIATPYANDDDIEGSLDLWVKRIKQHYTQNNVQWLAKGPGGKKLKPKSKKKDEGDSVSDQVETPKGPDLSKYDIPDLRKKLIEAGLPEDVVKIFSDADIVENARGMGLIEDGK